MKTWNKQTLLDPLFHQPSPSARGRSRGALLRSRRQVGIERAFDKSSPHNCGAKDKGVEDLCGLAELPETWSKDGSHKCHWTIKTLLLKTQSTTFRELSAHTPDDGIREPPNKSRKSLWKAKKDQNVFWRPFKRANEAKSWSHLNMSGGQLPPFSFL